MTVAEVQEMGNDEYVGWSMYFARIAQREELRQKMSPHRR